MKADLTTKNTQKFENLEDLLKYKTFLERITPNEFFKAKNDKKHKNRNNDNKDKKISTSGYNVAISDEIK
jgi:hypothetical protein